VIKANPNPWFNRLFTAYLERLMRKSFSGFHIVNNFPILPENKAVLFTPNHFSWWDGFLIQKIQREFLPKKIFFILMLVKQLKVYRFFNWMGAYGVEQESISSVMQTVKYTRELLSSPENLVIIYPQGEIQPYGIDKVVLQKGITKFAGGEASNSVVIPIAFKIQFDEDKKPAVYCSFGEVLEAKEVSGDFSLYESAFLANLEELEQRSLKRESVRDLFK